MRSALYYPHTKIQNQSTMKTALLLWDRIECIVPWKGFKPDYTDRAMAEAAEIIAVGHCPSKSEKQRAHQCIEEFVTRPLPEAFYYTRARPTYPEKEYEYEIYPQKLMPDTWRLLREAHFTLGKRHMGDEILREPGGLSIMSILADCCAGKTRVRVTDQSDAYATLAGLLNAPDDDPVLGLSAPHEQLVPTSLEIIDADGIDLKRLIEFRKREIKEGGHAIRDLRHRYLDRIESYVNTLRTVQANDSDVEEIKRQLADDMKDDLALLRDELRLARNEVFTSKEIIAAVMAGLATLASWAFGAPFMLEGVVTAAGAPAMILGVLGTRNKFLSSRLSIMQKHPMAYLYELTENRRVSLRPAAIRRKW